MNRKALRKYKWIEIVILIWALVAVFALSVLSATQTKYYQCFKLEISSDGELDIQQSGNKWIIKAYGVTGGCSGKTTSVSFKITNTGQKSDGTARRVDFVITTTGMASNDTSASKTLDASTTSLTYTATSGKGTSNYQEITISIDSYSQESIGSSVTTTFKPGTGGTIKVDGTAVNSQTDFVNSDDKTYALTATADPGYTFFGWMSFGGALTTDGAISFTYSGKNATTLWPLFIKSGSAVYYIQGANPLMYYGYLDEAITAAGNSGTIIVHLSGTVYHSDATKNEFTIPSGVKLLIPCRDGDAGVFGSMPKSTYALNDTVKDDGTVIEAAAPFAFRTLTVPADVTIVCNGEISINGHRTESGQGNYGPGAPRGGHGKLVLKGSGTQLTVNGSVYCYGFVTGSGTVEVTGTGKIHELFQIYDWPGGTNLAGSTGTGGWNSKADETTLFFASKYFIQNVEVPLKVHSGGKAYMEAVLTAGGDTKTASSELIGSSGLFQVGTGAHITRAYNPATDRVTYSTGGAGTISLGQIEVSATVLYVIPISVKSSSYTLGINNALTLHVGSGTTFNMNNRFALLPGSELIVDEGGTLNLSKPMFIIGKDDWTSAMSFGSRLAPRYTAGRGSTVKMQVKSSGRLEINGTLNISGGGGVYATGDATKNTDKIIYGAGTIIHGGTQPAGVLKGGYNETLTSFAVSDAFIVHKGVNGLQKIQKFTYYGLESEWYTHRVDYYENDSFIVTEYHVDDAFPEPSYTHEADNSLAVYLHGAWTTTSVNSYTRKYNRTCEGPYLAIYSDSTTKDDTTWGIANMYRLDDYLWLNAVGYLNGAFNSANLSVTTYDANGNIVATNAYGAIGDSLNEDGVQIAVVGTTVYLVKAIPAKEIPDFITFSISYDDGTKTYTSVNFTVSLEAYSSTLTGNDKTLADKLLAYGAAAKDYFGDKTSSGTGKPSVSHGLISPGEEKYQAQTMDGVAISTSGATIYFDEALRLSVKYQMTGVTGVTVGDYTIVQVGMLVQKLDNWNMANVLTTDPEKCSATAYIVYNTVPNKVITSGGSGNHPNIENAKGETAESVAEFKSEGLITFDLKAQDYKSGFAIRTYAVLQDKAGNYHCVYGKQYGYGLEAYINAMYTEGASAAEDKSFNNLLEKTWALAQVAK